MRDIMNRYLNLCWLKHGKKIPIEYQGYILMMLKEYGRRQFLIGFLIAFLSLLWGVLLYSLIN